MIRTRTWFLIWGIAFLVIVPVSGWLSRVLTRPEGPLPHLSRSTAFSLIQAILAFPVPILVALVHRHRRSRARRLSEQSP